MTPYWLRYLTPYDAQGIVFRREGEGGAGEGGAGGGGGGGDEPLTFPDVAGAVTVLEKEHGFIIRTKDQETSFFKKKIDESVGKSVSEIYTNFDKDILEATGVEKEAEEKTYDYMKRSITSLVEKITTLDKQVKDGVKGSDLLDQREAELKEVKATLKAKTTEWEEKETGWGKAQFRNKVQAKVNEALSKIKPTLKQSDVLSDVIELRVLKFMETVNPIDVNGEIVFNDKDGKPLTSQKDGNMLTAFDLLSEKFEDLVDSSRKQGGTGTGANGFEKGGGAGGGDDKDKYKLQLPETITSQMQLQDYLQKEKKLAPSDPEFTKFFIASRGELPLR